MSTTNDKYELIGGVLYHTPIDDTTEQIQSEYFVKAKQIADLLLSSKLEDIGAIINNIDEETRNYMNSPLVDFLMKNRQKEYDAWLSMACSSGNFNIIKYMIEHHHFGIKSDRVQHALQCASEFGHLEVVKYLHDRGAVIHINNCSAILHAAGSGHLEIVEYLINKSPGNIVDKLSRALQSAVNRGHLNVVKYLVKAGADLHVNNESPLRNACFYGHFEVVKYLVEAGADIHINNEAPLRNAFAGDHEKIVWYLIELGSHTQL